MMSKYFVFLKLLNFVAENYGEVTDADMNNYAGDIEIAGADEDGNTITIKVKFGEVKNDGN